MVYSIVQVTRGKNPKYVVAGPDPRHPTLIKYHSKPLAKAAAELLAHKLGSISHRKETTRQAQERYARLSHLTPGQRAALKIEATTEEEAEVARALDAATAAEAHRARFLAEERRQKAETESARSAREAAAHRRKQEEMHLLAEDQRHLAEEQLRVSQALLHHARGAPTREEIVHAARSESAKKGAETKAKGKAAAARELEEAYAEDEAFRRAQEEAHRRAESSRAAEARGKKAVPLTESGIGRLIAEEEMPPPPPPPPVHKERVHAMSAEELRRAALAELTSGSTRLRKAEATRETKGPGRVAAVAVPFAPTSSEEFAARKGGPGSAAAIALEERLAAIEAAKAANAAAAAESMGEGRRRRKTVHYGSGVYELEAAAAREGARRETERISGVQMSIGQQPSSAPASSAGGRIPGHRGGHKSCAICEGIRALKGTPYEYK